MQKNIIISRVADNVQQFPQRPNRMHLCKVAGNACYLKYPSYKTGMQIPYILT